MVHGCFTYGAEEPGNGDNEKEGLDINEVGLLHDVNGFVEVSLAEVAGVGVVEHG